MSDHSISMLSFKASYQMTSFQGAYRCVAYNLRDMNANANSIFTQDELATLYKLTQPYQKAGLIKPVKPPHTLRFDLGTEKTSVFTVHRRDLHEPWCEVSKDWSANEACASYHCEEALVEHRLLSTFNFDAIERRVKNILEASMKKPVTQLSLVR